MQLIKTTPLSYWYDVARELMNQHGLRHWVFQYDNAKRRAGRCSPRRKTISLSTYYVHHNTDDDIKDTLLHEIAHSLTPGHHHDDVWKARCVEIGARPERCYDSSVVVMPKGQYVAHCPTCQKEFHRHRKHRIGHWSYCTKCGQEKGRLTYKKI